MSQVLRVTGGQTGGSLLALIAIPANEDKNLQLTAPHQAQGYFYANFFC
jgi:hypothetical protein